MSDKPRILLVDLSGILHRNYAVNAGKGDVDAAANQTLSHIRWLSSQYDHVAICCDSGRSFRHEIAKQIREWDPEHRGYKGKRPEADPVLISQMRRVERELYAEGFHVFRAEGFEADDVIATLCAWARANGYPVDVGSEDKDLRALVTDEPPQVRVIRKDGVVVGTAEVKEKFGVPPERLIELLAIAGDTADGVPGVSGLGEGKAAKVLTGFGSFEAAQQVASDEAADVIAEEALRKDRKARGEKMGEWVKRKMTPSTRDALVNGEKAYRVSLSLVTLRTDVPLDCERVLADKVPPPDAVRDAEHDALLAAATAAADEEDAAILAAAEEMEQQAQEQIETMTTPIQEAEFTDANKPASDRPAAVPVIPQAAPTLQPAPVAAMTPTAPVATPQAVTAPQNTNAAAPKPAQAAAMVKAGPPVEFNKQLEARNQEQAWWLAQKIAGSKKIRDAGDADTVMLKLAVGRSLDMPLYQSLRLYLMEGQVVMRTSQVLARVKSSPLCEYIRLKHLDDKSCTWETKRRGDPPQSRTFTIEMAKRAMLGGIGKPDDKGRVRTEFDPASAWAKWTEDMLSARAVMPLMRQEYPEIADGYSMEELGADSRTIVDTTGEAA